MIVKFLIVFLLFFLVTPGLFVKVPIKGNHIVVALIHSIIFALLLWLVCNCLKLKEGFSIKTETEKTNKLIDQLKNATTKEEIDNDVAQLKSELKRLIAMRNNDLYMGKKHPDHATEFKNDALTLDSVIDKAKTAIADAEAKKTTPAKKPVPVPAPAKKTVPVPAPDPAKKLPSAPTQIDLTLSVDCNNVTKDDVAPLKFSSKTLTDKYTISVSFFYNNQPRNNIIIQSTPNKLEEISASNKYAKDVFTGKETMIPTSVKPIAYFFAPFTCAGEQFPERDTKGPFIFTLTDSKNKKYYFLFNTENMSIPMPNYCIKLANFIKELKKKPANPLEFSIICVKNSILRNMTAYIFKLTAPLSPVYIVKNKEEGVVVFNDIMNGKEVTCKKVIPKTSNNLNVACA